MKKNISILFLFVGLNTFAQNTVIKAGHFFDARTGKMIDNQMIIVQNTIKHQEL